MSHMMDYHTLPSSTDHSSDTENEYSSSGGEESIGASDMEHSTPPTSPHAPSLPLHHKFHKNKYTYNGTHQKSNSSSNSRSSSPNFNSNGKDERECGWCGTKQTPMWRRGPLGKSTLCNACGVRYSLSPNQTKDKVQKMLKHQSKQQRSSSNSKHNHNHDQDSESDSSSKSPNHSFDDQDSNMITVVNHNTNTTTNSVTGNGGKGYYYCRYCDQSWDMNYFKNSQQFGAHCSNCSRKRRVKDVGNIVTSNKETTTTTTNSHNNKENSKEKKGVKVEVKDKKEEMKELVKEVEKERDREMEEVRKEVNEVMDKWKDEWSRVLVENEKSVQNFLTNLYSKYNIPYIGASKGVEQKKGDGCIKVVNSKEL